MIMESLIIAVAIYFGLAEIADAIKKCWGPKKESGDCDNGKI